MARPAKPSAPSFPPTATSICRPVSNRAGSTSWCTPPATRWCTGSAMSRCATSSASSSTDATGKPPGRIEQAYALGPLADRSLSAGFRLSRLQRGRRRPPRVRRRHAARGRRRAEMAQPPVCRPYRFRRAAIRRSFQSRRQIPLLLCLEHRSPDRPPRRHPETAGHRSAGHAYPDRDRVLEPPRLAGPY